MGSKSAQTSTSPCAGMSTHHRPPLFQSETGPATNRPFGSFSGKCFCLALRLGQVTWSKNKASVPRTGLPVVFVNATPRYRAPPY